MKLKRWHKITLGILVVINLLFVVTDTTYIYKTLRYNYVNIDDYKIFDNRKIEKGEEQVWELSEEYNTESLSPEFENRQEEIGTVAFLVARKGKLVYEKYWEDHTKTSISNSFSMGKSVVSILTGMAIEEGYIKSLDDFVGDYLPYYKKDGKEKITLRHLITMTSGLNWIEAYGLPISHTTEAYYGRDLVKLAKKLKLKNEPGSHFHYKSGDTQLLALVLRKATGKSLAEYASEKLWKPLGAESEALWCLDKEEGVEKAYCCLNATARDFAKLGQFYLQSGKWKGQRLVSKEWVEASVQPLGEVGEDTIDFYGYSWWLLNDLGYNKVYYARGLLGQHIIVLPEEEMVIVRLGHTIGKNQEHHYSDTPKFIEEAKRQFGA